MSSGCSLRINLLVCSQVDPLRILLVVFITYPTVHPRCLATDGCAGVASVAGPLRIHATGDNGSTVAIWCTHMPRPAGSKRKHKVAGKTSPCMPVF